ncbi:Alpha/Beta hydrolase protein [Dactylonectria macrodidyma]|uniref:Alpha/Beta hydrolase protein n=1 Tax=Dactylonectria macrodidyma TaxID=307937 RepID=A0A9P9DV79_9HYPO|nr:Alpha/Beta hydrolase protein [Dactylonectria macrodidyma]
MWRFFQLMLGNPLRSIKFTYSFTVQTLLICLRNILLPHHPKYQTFRLQIHRAYWAAASTFFPTLIHRLPVTNCPETRARRIGSDWTAYVIPGIRELHTTAQTPGACVVVYAHGGGYARGEARMYLNYMERWQSEAASHGLEITFVSVEYPLTDVASHPAQRNSFLDTYKYVLEQGVQPSQVIFMGDSAGGGCCLLSSLELKNLGLPQPAAGILISPWFDMSLRSFDGGNAFVETDYIVTANEGVPAFAKRWIGDIDGASPEVNPLFRTPSEFKDLPPQLILVGGGDFVLPECRDLAQLFDAAELPHKFFVEWGQFHLYALGSKWIDSFVRAKTDSVIFEWISEALPA